MEPWVETIDDAAQTVASGGLTKHETLANLLRSRIEKLPLGSALPPERTLAAEFGVARMTLRHALDELERKGLIVRRQGSGTFTARPRLNHVVAITSFTEEMRRLGMSASTVNLGGSLTSAGARIGAKLRVSPSEPVWNIGRLRLADQEPMAIEWVSIPESLVPGMTLEDFSGESLYGLLEERYGIRLTGGRQMMEATVTDEAASRDLGVPLHSPALFVDRVIWTADEQVVEHVHAIYRGDRYSFTADLHMPDR